MSRRIYGSIQNMENGQGIPGLIVEAYDADMFSDDFLAKSKTDGNGSYSVEIKNKSGFMDKPDVYLLVKTKDGKFLTSTRNNVIKDVDKDIEINVDVSHFDLYNAGVIKDAPEEWKKIVDFVMTEPKYQKFTLNAAADNDPMIKEIYKDLEGCVSVLDLFKKYTEDLHGSKANNSPVFKKMDKLFEYGLPYDEMGGHYYGIGIGLKTYGINATIKDNGDILNYFYSIFQGRDSTWIGKTHWEISQEELDKITGGKVKVPGKIYQGWNHFHKLPYNSSNPFFYHFMDFWLHCENSTPYQHEKYHADKNGAGLIAYATNSIFNKDKKVFRLSYRWPHFNNPFPIKWIFDEMVQVAHGIYLGQLLCASRHLLEAYDPEMPPEEYAYNNWGYFLLVTDDWAPEARRLFTYLDISADADALIPAPGSIDVSKPKFTTLTLEKDSAPYYNNVVFGQIAKDLSEKSTVLHLIKDYSQEIVKAKGSSTPADSKLAELFHRGLGVKELNGYYRGAILGQDSNGPGEQDKVKSLRTCDPWTGKCFNKITPQKAMDITDGFEKADVPTYWGSNTLSFRDQHENKIGQMMKNYQVKVDKVPDDVAMKFGYDAEFLYFIARQGKSANPACKGKDVFQLNYRWPKLKSIVPDRWCVDEVVQIADGLYIAQLLYAADTTKPYDPNANPDVYKYGSFGYFLLMDEEWHKIRLQIGLDIYNA